MKLPRGKKEFVIFMAIISLISVNIIAPLITCFEIGFSITAWREAISIIPFIWLCVVMLVLLTYRPAEWMTMNIIEKEDSFGAHVTVNILCTVFLMSIFLTVIGTWIGSREFNMEPIQRFFYRWPRNFAISFGVEFCIAQPIARGVMFKIHQIVDMKISK